MQHFATFVIAAALITPAQAGPLTPPAGAPAPTNKTLQQVEPRIAIAASTTISQPGNYYLTNDISSSFRAIEITASGVTLDLNGFSLRGDGVGFSDVGILLSGTSDNRPVVIRNGSIRNFPGEGVDTADSTIHIILDNVHVSDCGVGFDLNAPATLTDCTARACAGDGFQADRESIFERCTARDNTGNGFNVEFGVLVTCVASGNGADGFNFGSIIGAVQPSSATNCLATGSGLAGFHTQDPITLTNCNAEGGSYGFQLSSNASLQGCTARDNSVIGFLTGENTSVHACIAANNASAGFALGANSSITSSTSSSNGVSGFNLGTGGAVAHCAARNNTTDGFALGNASVCSNSVATNNGEDGFALNADCRITNCTADANGIGGAFAGIRGTSDSTIESCTATDNPTGIIAGTGGLMIKNTAAGNTTSNYNIAGASYGPVITAGGAIVSTNPFSNISY